MENKKHFHIFSESSEFIENEIKEYACKLCMFDEIVLSDEFISYLLNSIITSNSINKDVFSELLSSLYANYDDKNYFNTATTIKAFFDGLKDDLSAYAEKLKQGVLYDLREDLEEMKSLRSEAQ